MNYFFSTIFRDKHWGMLLGLAALAGLIILDILSYMLMGNGFFNLWVVKLTIGAAMAGAIVYGVILHRREKKSRRLELLLPGFIAARRAWFERRATEDREFQTFCHECRHFDPQRLRCLLRLQERQTRIKLQQESVFSYCLYWNLGDRHPVMLLTERVQPGTESPRSPENGEANPQAIGTKSR